METIKPCVAMQTVSDETFPKQSWVLESISRGVENVQRRRNRGNRCRAELGVAEVPLSNEVQHLWGTACSHVSPSQKMDDFPTETDPCWIVRGSPMSMENTNYQRYKHVDHHEFCTQSNLHQSPGDSEQCKRWCKYQQPSWEGAVIARMTHDNQI